MGEGKDVGTSVPVYRSLNDDHFTNAVRVLAHQEVLPLLQLALEVDVGGRSSA